MARIRSIKPDFFTSEVIASLPLSARVTFIGLWTYVDDNGVGLDNERLIVAAIWPLENDPLETLRRTREDLQSLQEGRLITRYRDSGRRYLHIRSWGEHQTISHPRKPRYPSPPAKTPTPVTLRRSSRVLRRSSVLSREQGAGSREQGRPPRPLTRTRPAHPPQPSAPRPSPTRTPPLSPCASGPLSTPSSSKPSRPESGPTARSATRPNGSRKKAAASPSKHCESS